MSSSSRGTLLTVSEKLSVSTATPDSSDTVHGWLQEPGTRCCYRLETGRVFQYGLADKECAGGHHVRAPPGQSTVHFFDSLTASSISAALP